MADLILIKPPASHGARIEAQDTAITFDVTPSETHEQSAQISNHPVETGVDVTDHVRALPFTLNVNARLTATPMGEAEQEPDRLRKKHEELLALVQAGTVFRMVTGLKAYEDMVVSTYKAGRSAALGQSLDCTIALQQIRRVQAVEVEIPARILAPVVRPSGQSERDKGEQTGTQPDEVEDARAKTWLASAVDFIAD